MNFNGHLAADNEDNSAPLVPAATALATLVVGSTFWNVFVLPFGNYKHIFTRSIKNAVVAKDSEKQNVTYCLLVEE